MNTPLNSGAKVKLTKGMSAIVDEVDFERVNAFKWHVKESAAKKTSYARRATYKDGKQSIVFMHQMILGAGDGQVIDHINRDGLDNRRANLRLVSARESNLNRSFSSTSGYRGVYWRGKNWLAQINANGRKLYRGSYQTKEDAAIAYDMAALTYNGDFAQTNILKVI